MYIIFPNKNIININIREKLLKMELHFRFKYYDLFHFVVCVLQQAVINLPVEYCIRFQ